jgi:biotin/methionine sulfoxide reductase
MGERRLVRNLAHWGAFTAVVEDGRLVQCLPFERDPHPSPMLEAIVPMVYSSERIARPLVRQGWINAKTRGRRDTTERGRDHFVEVSWSEALGLVASELARVRGESGAEGIFGGSYGWASAGRLHHARSLLRRLLFLSGGCVDQVGNYSWGAAKFLLPHIIGTAAPMTGLVTSWRDIAQNARLVVCFGGLAEKNAQVASGGAGEHMQEEWLRLARAAGVEFVNVSPTRGDVPRYLGAEWIPIRPNTDTALMLALAHQLVVEGGADREFLSRYCVGFETLRAYLLGGEDGVEKSAAWAAGVTGVPEERIKSLSRRLASHPSFLTASFSLQRARHGEQPYWMLIALACMLGGIGKRGLGFGFGHGSINGVGNSRPETPGPSMPVPRNPSELAIPAARMAEMLLHPGEEYEFDGQRLTYPSTKLVYWAGGNPFHHHQDLNRLERAWQRPETIIVQEIWWTATARRADIVLPATTSLERNDIGGSSRDRYVLAMHQAIEPVGDARSDFDILSELAAHLGVENAFTEGRDELGWVRWIYERVCDGNYRGGVSLPPFSEFWDRGFAEIPLPSRDPVMFSTFRQDPIGAPLATPSGRIEIASEMVQSFGYEECPGHPAWLPPDEWLGAPMRSPEDLHLVSVQPKTRLHSQMDAGPVSAASKVGGLEAISVSPEDASRLGVKRGDVVKVWNARGACLAGLAVDDGIMAGVAVMPTGAWYTPTSFGGETVEARGNPNVLTNDNGTSRLTQGPNAMSVLVRIERWQYPTSEKDSIE